MFRIAPIVFVALLLAVTFASGVVAGRLWARQPLVLSSDSSSSPAPAPRRGGLVDAETARPRGVEDQLTFYRTLTAPLGPAPATGKPHGESRGRSPEDRPPALREAARHEARPAATTVAAASTPVATNRPTTPGPLVAAAAVAEGPGLPDRPATASAAGPAPAWSVQVGVFKGRQQAETAHRRLVEGGIHASLTPTTVDGEMRYRVRAGSYRTRAEAERVAERVRSDRALPTYITMN